MARLLAATVETLLQYCPAPLIDPDAANKLLSIARRVPDAFHNVGFECRLGADAGAVDLGVSLLRGFERAYRAHGPWGDPTAPLSGGSAEGWRQLLDFSRRWSADGSHLAEWVPFLFLEFDALAAFDATPVPSVFVALDAPLEERPDHPDRKAAEEAAALLRGCDLPAELVAKLDQCFDEIPDGGCVLHLGLMLGRGAAGLRLSVVLPSVRVAPYLASLGGRTAADEAERALRLLPRWLSRAQVDFDIDPGVRPRIGFSIRPDSASRDQWSSLLGELRRLGCCDAPRERALLAWPGSAEGLRREISHVKVVFDSGQIEAKAYVGAEAS